MPGGRFRPDLKHPQPWESDLNPHALAGENVGVLGPHPEDDAPTAYDLKPLHGRLSQFTDDELKQIPVLPAGSRLEQGATYIDLHAADCHEFRALGNMEAGPDNWYVPKDSVGYVLWNRLLGVQNPARLDEAPRPQ
ncbi:MAG TPA: hypothetical protein VK066_10980 [Chloroflexota bacterium]|nr:hypothetical protein [Chloroflexota bacterium]